MTDADLFSHALGITGALFLLNGEYHFGLAMMGIAGAGLA